VETGSVKTALKKYLGLAFSDNYIILYIYDNQFLIVYIIKCLVIPTPQAVL